MNGQREAQTEDFRALPACFSHGRSGWLESLGAEGCARMPAESHPLVRHLVSLVIWQTLILRKYLPCLDQYRLHGRGPLPLAAGLPVLLRCLQTWHIKKRSGMRPAMSPCLYGNPAQKDVEELQRCKEDRKKDLGNG